MSSIRFRNLLLAGMAMASALRAQNVLVTVRAASDKVLVAGTGRVTASVTTLHGTPLSPSTLNWRSSDENVATVGPDGIVKGLAPGIARVGVTDTESGAAAWAIIHVVPASLSLAVSSPTLAAGDTAQLTPSALDALGKPIAGLRFRYRSGASSVASIAGDGVVTGQGEGVVTLQASLAGDPALIATTQLRVLPKPSYKLRKMISTDASAATSITAVTALSAASSTAIGAIVTLANGGQAAMMIEAGKPRVLAVAGQTLPGTGRLVLRIDAISTNAKGDTALLLEYPNQWCVASVFLFPKGQPETEIAPANCGNGISSHSLADDGSILYRYSDQIWTASAKSAPAMLFSVATQPTQPDAIRFVNNFTAGGGAYVIQTTLESGATGYFWSDGKAFTRVYRTGDPIRGSSLSMDVPIASADGQFYARGNGTNYVALVQLGSFGLKTLLATGDSVTGGTLGWIHYLTDAGGQGVLFGGDFNVPNNYHSVAGLWKNGVTTEAAPTAGWGGIVAGALPADGIPVVWAVLKSDTKIPGLRSLPPSQDPRTILEAGANFPVPAPAGVDWHYPSRGGSASMLPMHGAGEAVVRVDSTGVRNIATVGSLLPNGKIATWIGGAAANGVGDLVFTAGYPAGSMMVRWRGGNLETLADNGAQASGLTPFSVPSWLYGHRGRYLAINNRGDVAYVASFQGGSLTNIVLITGGVPKLVATLNTRSPGNGPLYTSFNSVAIDEKQRVLFNANLSDGSVGVFLWDGNSVQRVIGTGDKTSTGTVNEISNIGGAGNAFLIVLAVDNYRARELRYFDTRLRTIDSTDTTLLSGTWMNYFWMNEATLGANGDVHYQVQTQDSGAGVYARRADGSLAIVARSRDPLPGGEWLIFPLTVSSSSTGEVWFTAYTWKDGVEALSLYLATPQ